MCKKFIFNFYFDLILPFYSLKWNRYFSACGNFPIFFMSFLKAQVSFVSTFSSIFSANKDNSSVLFSSNIIYFGQRSQLKSKVFRLSSVLVKCRQIPHVNFERISQFLLNFESFLIAMTHNSPVNFKLIHFKSIPSKSQF